MNRALKNFAMAFAVATVASGGFAQKAVAANSTAGARFADQFAVMQSLSSSGSPTFQSGRLEPGSAAGAPASLTFADMQAAASNSAMWQPRVERPSMTASAPVPPGGLAIAYYQALSGNSATWQVPYYATGTAYAAAPSTNGSRTALSFQRRSEPR